MSRLGTLGRGETSSTAFNKKASSSPSSAPIPLEPPVGRALFINDVLATATAMASLGKVYAGNDVCTSKYTLLSFLPKTLLEQFRRVANFYFLIISLLQLGTPYSPTNKYSTIVPLILVLFATMVKEAIEDKARHDADRAVNQSKTEVFDVDGQTWIEILWKDLRVGDLVRVVDSQPFPADMVLLTSSSNDGQVYVETANLDGETDLKIRSCPDSKGIEMDAGLFPLELVGEITCEPPNRRLYTFAGALKIKEHSQRQSVEIALTINNLVLRGMTLANTSTIVGVVVAAGSETKLMLNSKKTPSKFSRLDAIANRCIMLIFSVLFIVCCVSTGLSMATARHKGQLARMVHLTISSDDPEASFLSSFLTYLILYNNLVPISLYISLEVVKWYQAKNMESDLAMMDPATGRSAQARTSNLNEDVGQIKHLFSDKTGTITRNEMVLKYIHVNNTVFEKTPTVTRQTSIKRDSSLQREHLTALHQADRLHTMEAADIVIDYFPKLQALGTEPTIFPGSELSCVNDGTNSMSAGEVVQYFMRCMLLCHTASISSDTREIRASSPDETALLRAAKLLNCDFLGRSENIIEISLFGVREKYELLALNEFDSTRKSMSIIVRTQKVDRSDEDELWVFCKGADSTLLSATNNYYMHERTEYLSRHVQYFASLGLRTLVFGYKRLSFVEFSTWFVAYCKAKTSLVRRGAKLTECARSMETNLIILGATGVEDQLQDGVTECIEALSEAGINIWMLTGDKDETAVSVGTACGLISEHSHLVVINETTKRGCLEQIATARRKLKKIGLWRPGVASREVSLVINGEALESLLSTEDPTSTSMSRVSNTIPSSNHDKTASSAKPSSSTSAQLFSGDASRTRLDKRTHLGPAEYIRMETRPNHASLLRHSRTLGGVGAGAPLSQRKQSHEHIRQTPLDPSQQLPTRNSSFVALGSAGRAPEMSKTKLVLRREPNDMQSSEVGSESSSPCDSNQSSSNVMSFWRSLLVNSSGMLPRHKLASAFPSAEHMVAPSKSGDTIIGTVSLTALRPPPKKSIRGSTVVAPNVLGSMSDLSASPSLLQLARLNMERSRDSPGSVVAWMECRVIAAGQFAKRLLSTGSLAPSPPSPTTSAGSVSNQGKTNMSSLARVVSNVSSKLITSVISSVKSARVRRSNDEDDDSSLVRLHAIDSDLSVMMFLQLVTQCRSVIACRMSPIQKAQIVALIKSSKRRPMTMAVGDGGNDVSMIQEANIGVGIFGHEGMQAVRSADFAIGQFRFLSRLILVHGRWNYRRVSIVILFSFYKNMALIMTLFAYSFLNGHSGQTLYESYLMVGWNALYTFFPILVLGIKDEDISAEAVMRFPFIYRTNQLDKELNIEKMRLWVGNALLHSFLVFVLTTFLVYKLGTHSIPTAGVFVYGTAVYGILVVTVCAKAAMIMQHVHRWSKWHYLSIVSGPALFVIFVASYSEAFELVHVDAFSDFFGLGRVLFTSVAFWLGVLVVSFSSLLLDFVVMYLYRMYLPTNQVIIEEIDCRLERRVTASMRMRSSSSLATSLLFHGNWHKQLRKSTHFTEHEEMCWLLAKFERDISRETNESQQNDDKDMGFIVTSTPPIHPITMEFMGEDYEPLEAEYNRSFAEREARRIRVLVILVLVFIPPYAVTEYVYEQDTDLYPYRIAMFCCTLGYLFYIKSEKFLSTYHVSVSIPLGLAGLVVNQSIKYTGKFSTTMFAIVAFSIIRVKFVYTLWLVLFNVAYFILSNEMGLTSIELSSESSDDEGVLFAIFMVYLVVFAAYDNYQLQMTMKLEFVQLRILKYEEHRSRDILKNMLPSHIVKKLENGETLVSDEEKGVALLFCDVGDAASLTKRYNPREMVVLLDRIYSLFDKLCAKHGVRKMETVGKIYLACGGLRGSAKGKEAVLRVAALARDMMAVMAKCRTRNGHTINLKIGIHCGRVISGLVGMKKQQFSLFGDTVNTASRMQSTGLLGHIQISHEAHEFLEHDFQFDHRTVVAKGKGTLATHLMGKPRTALAQRACRGHLGRKATKKAIDTRRLSLTQEFQRTLIETWGHLVVSRWNWRSWACFQSIKVDVKPISSLQSVQEEYVTTQINQSYIRFNDPAQEMMYRRMNWPEHQTGAKRTLVAIAIYMIFATIRDNIQPNEFTGSREYAKYKFPFVPQVLRHRWKPVAKTAPQKTHNSNKKAPKFQLYLSVYVVATVILVVPNVIRWIDHQQSKIYSHMGLDILLVMFLASTGGSIMYTHTVVINAVLVLGATILFVVLLGVYEVPDQPDGEKLRVYPLFLTCCVGISNVMSRRDVEYYSRRRFLLYTRTGKEAKKADRLLYKMLPSSVIAQLKNGDTVCDQFHEVGILFSDIKGFTSIASKAETDQVVQILATLFTAFDKLTSEHGVFKMQTIGDAYVIVSGLPYNDVPLPEENVNEMLCGSSFHGHLRQSQTETQRSTVENTTSSWSTNMRTPKDPAATREHIQKLIHMAHDMHREVAKITDPVSGEPLLMRIGIHVGTIIAGVIGTSTLRYDMWGPDVLTANEIESHGVPGKILVSKDVMQVASQCPDIKLTYHSTINLTGINDLDTFLAEYTGGSFSSADRGLDNSTKVLSPSLPPRETDSPSTI
ncbi:hypothetical protein H310_01166 [Aphanomyces invadans]|uniref:P-type phospholipid transporter n=1 Tax=Aphanomyces invadans TaxID=157072 RepID=A0A024UR24_9STRA|nr:hypothetical protein H310_01166 [Aphanomyces invadans]ETW08630.1 hypothetical protein H310_01166 [Aphanomyces invadans]|eukprot:XP_008862435.1 hypothetical protein H310_01166 [Aphanomyces invadans]